MTLAESRALASRAAYAVGQRAATGRRGAYDPAYLNYTLGKLMIRKLRGTGRRARRARAWRQFHDQFLSYGGPPIPLVRAAMLGSDTGPLF